MRTEVGDCPLCFGRRRGQKTAKAKGNISPSETKRFAGWVVSHWNHYMRRINDFAGLFVFRDLTAFSFRTSALPGPNGPKSSDRRRRLSCPRKRHPATLWRDLDSRLRGNDKTPGCDSVGALRG